MSETLVIRLRADAAAQASWVIVDANGARSGALQGGPVADALAATQQRSVLLLLPGSDVTLAEPELPVRGGARLAQAVPFALEEQLASDLDDLHFAVGTRATGAAAVPVAVVARASMDRWLGACVDAGIRPDAAYADSMAVPPTAGGTTRTPDCAPSVRANTGPTSPMAVLPLAIAASVCRSYSAPPLTADTR